MLKKFYIIMVVMCFLVTAMSGAVSASEPTFAAIPAGDVNGDAKINSIDLSLMQRYILGLISDFPVDDDMWSADLNGDGKINSTDYSLLKRFILEIIDKFPKEQPKVVQVEISLGATHTSITAGDSVLVFGDNSSGQLGLGENSGSTSPVTVPDLPHIWRSVSGLRHMVAIDKNNNLWAWGSNDKLQLIDDTVAAGESGEKISYKPFKVASVSGVKDIIGGYNRTVLIKDDGTVWLYSAASLVTGTNNEVFTPYELKELKGIERVSIGFDHIMGLKDDGTVLAGGNNYWGQLGNGDQDHHNSSSETFDMVSVKNLTDVTAISAGRNHSTALKNDGTVWAWGCSLSGELGYGSVAATNSMLPGMVEDLEEVVAISAGNSYTVALKKDGTVWSWGRNTYGQLGDGSTANQRRPVQVEGLSGIVAVKAGWDHTVAIGEDGDVWTWGRNDCGQLGDGTKENRLSPVKIYNLFD